MFTECRCGSVKFFTKENGKATGLYCSKCGKWQKWLSKNEVRLFENSKSENDNEQSEYDATPCGFISLVDDILAGCKSEDELKLRVVLMKEFINNAEYKRLIQLKNRRKRNDK